jgi:hypothetical protein
VNGDCKEDFVFKYNDVPISDAKVDEIKEKIEKYIKQAINIVQTKG